MKNIKEFELKDIEKMSAKDAKNLLLELFYINKFFTIAISEFDEPYVPLKSVIKNVYQ